MKPLLFGIFLASLLFATTTGSAHHLWITVDEDGEERIVNVVFEHGHSPGDGRYIPHFVRRGTTWLHDAGGVHELDMADTRESDQRWLRASIENASPFAVSSYGLFGVYRYGKDDVLLHYYAKTIAFSSAEELASRARAETLDLDLVPSLAPDGQVTVQLLWSGEPVAGRRVAIRGKTIRNLFTGDDGRVTFEPKERGRHTFLASLEEEESGTDPADGQDYIRVLHQTTLLLDLP